MMEQQYNKSKVFSRILTVILLLALTAGNSALFYFVIWDMLSPSRPFAVMLFIISGSAHLIYFFLPWFISSFLGPVFRRSDKAQAGGSTESTRLFGKLCAQVGIVLCASVIGLWLVQQGLTPEERPMSVLITSANCQEIGGIPEMTEDKLVCIIMRTGMTYDNPAGASRTANRN